MLGADLWEIDLATLAAILAMTAATLVCRFGGYLIIARLPKSRFLDAWLSHLPGAMFVALVVPALARGGVAFWIGAVAVLVAARAKLPLIVALCAGVGVVAAIRALGF
ncbi:MAG: AzlD domain-containing protein [Alphaproteobacteria bacterium]|nr:AzlD domain-containing protein [Alphaproteobacteria bacterium]TAD88309.1 MAG: AzlD domain-containing protein [Alphaproteobacteria bacterium]